MSEISIDVVFLAILTVLSFWMARKVLKTGSGEINSQALFGFGKKFVCTIAVFAFSMFLDYLRRRTMSEYFMMPGDFIWYFLPTGLTGVCIYWSSMIIARNFLGSLLLLVVWLSLAPLAIQIISAFLSAIGYFLEPYTDPDVVVSYLRIALFDSVVDLVSLKARTRDLSAVINDPFWALPTIGSVILSVLLRPNDVDHVGLSARATGPDYAAAGQGVTEPTRFALCALLSDRRFRTIVRRCTHDRHLVWAPDLGIDGALLGEAVKARDRWALVHGIVMMSVICGAVAALWLSLWLALLGFSAAIFLEVNYRCWTLFYLLYGLSATESNIPRVLGTLGVCCSEPTIRTEPEWVAYDGYSSFGFAGLILDQLVAAVDLSKPDRNSGRGETDPVQITMMHSRVKDDLRSIAPPNTELVDCFVVPGVDFSEDASIQKNSGHSSNDMEHMHVEEGGVTISPLVRRYIRSTNYLWNGDVILTHFIGFGVEGCILGLEITRTVLLPIDRKWRWVDKLPARCHRVVAARAIKEFLMSPVQMLASVIDATDVLCALAESANGSALRQWQRRLSYFPRLSRAGDESIRVRLAGPAFTAGSQRVDQLCMDFALSRRVIDSIIGILEEHNIDASSLQETRTQLVNHGLIIHGGDVKAEALAVGKGAAATAAMSSTVAGSPTQR